MSLGMYSLIAVILGLKTEFSRAVCGVEQHLIFFLILYCNILCTNVVCHVFTITDPNPSPNIIWSGFCGPCANMRNLSTEFSENWSNGFA